MALSQFWRERQTEFEKYQQQFRDLKARWYVSGQTWWLQCGESSEGSLNPPQQALDVFKAIARTIVAGWTDIRAEIASKPYPRVAANAEPWEVWLDFMRVREWGFRVTGRTRCNEYEWDAGVKDGRALNAVRKELKYTTGDEDRNLYRRLPNGSLKRLSAKELKGKWSEDLQKYYHWLEDGVIEHVFESSARFCEDLAARAFESEAAASGADGRPGRRRLSELPAAPPGKSESRDHSGSLDDSVQKDKTLENPLDWGAIEISFLSDERVQIRHGEATETRNYAEFAFADGRTEKPNLAWITLRAMAMAQGIIPDGKTAGDQWKKVEKRIQEIRKVFQKHFGISADPIPFVPGTGYQARFKIGCSLSFHT
jgi:hypothetical protein